MNNNFDPNSQNGYGAHFYSNAWSAPPSLEKDIRHSFSKIGLSLFAYIAVSNVVAIAAQFLIILIVTLSTGSPEGALGVFDNPFVSAGLGILPMYIVGLPILYLIIRKMEKRSRKPLKMGAREFFGFFFVSVLLMYLGSYIGEMLNAMFSGILGHQIQNSTSNVIESWPIWLVFILVVILGPLVEEFIFRKLLIDRMSVYGDKIAIVISAVAFGIHHGNFFQFFYAAFLGLVLGYMYVKTNRLIYPFLMHAALNFIGSIIPMSLYGFFDELTALEESLLLGAEIDMGRYYLCLSVSALYSLVMFGMMITGAVILFKNFRKIKIDPYCRIDIPHGRVFSLTVGNVGMILFLIAGFAVFGLSLMA